MKPLRLLLIRARIAMWRKVRGGPRNPGPRFSRRHWGQAVSGITRRERKARARIDRLAARKGTEVNWR